jgi:RNA polymerase sigma-70 factor, ECF subfamily
VFPCHDRIVEIPQKERLTTPGERLLNEFPVQFNLALVVILSPVARTMSAMGVETTRTSAIDWLFNASAKEADWDSLFVEQLPRIYNFFRYRVADGAVAEDLTSITFEKAWGARLRYRRDLASFSTWLFTIARNVAVDYFRQRRTEVPLDEISDRGDDQTPETVAVRQSEFKRLCALLANLPDRERELLALKYGSGLTNRAIAKITGLTESNIGTILHRTIASLRAQW